MTSCVVAAIPQLRKEERMLNMSQILTIREKHSSGESISGIAKALSIDRKTVARYIDQDDFSPKPPVKKTSISKVDPKGTTGDNSRGQQYV